MARQSEDPARPVPAAALLRVGLVSQPMPVFAVFYLDRKQRLIRFAELAHGSGDLVTAYPKEVIGDTLACGDIEDANSPTGRRRRGAE